MNINPNIDSRTGTPFATKIKPSEPTERPDAIEKIADSVQLSPAGINHADIPPPGQTIENSEIALETALSAAQKITQDSPDGLYDWSSMTPERLKELLI